MTFGTMLSSFLTGSSPSNVVFEVASISVRIVAPSHIFSQRGDIRGWVPQDLYGERQAFLYVQANDFNKIAKFYYVKAEDT